MRLALRQADGRAGQDPERGGPASCAQPLGMKAEGPRRGGFTNYFTQVCSGSLVFKARRVLYHSTPGLRGMKRIRLELLMGLAMRQAYGCAGQDPARGGLCKHL